MLMQQTVLVGKLTNIYAGSIELESSTDPNHSVFTIELSNNILDHVKEYTEIGDVVGVKCRLESRFNNVVLVGDKVTFLSSHNTEGR